MSLERGYLHTIAAYDGLTTAAFKQEKVMPGMPASNMGQYVVGGMQIMTMARNVHDVSLKQLFRSFPSLCCRWADDLSSNTTDSDTSDGFWICKNSWGQSWGLGGNIHIAYGSAGLLSNDVYALRFGLDVLPRGLEVARMLQQGMTYDSNSDNCLLFTAQQPMRMIRLLDDLFTLALAAVENRKTTALLREEDIIGELVAANLGSSSLFAASTGPFRLCGKISKILESVLTLPPRNVSWALANDGRDVRLHWAALSIGIPL
jgi:hypothetical protein